MSHLGGGATDIQVVQARETARHPVITHRPVPQNKDLSSLKCHCAEIEKPCYRRQSLKAINLLYTSPFQTVTPIKHI